MVGIRGTRLEAEERELLLHPQIGGVILFARNYDSPEQLAALTREIHALRTPALLIAVDQEGGRVQRFQQGFTRLPAVGRLAEVYDRDPEQATALAQASGYLMALELGAVGVDLSFAPVLDLGLGISGIIGDRAFHSDPEAVAKLADAYIGGMHRAGMAATGKHFPGHGSIAPDSHLELPRDERPWDAILAADLVPFERLARSGIDAMMTAHVVYPALDERPASFSQRWINEILRGRLGFDGVVFSDDLGMQAACELGDYPSRALAALEAGCDMVLVCNELEEIPALLQSLPAPSPEASRRLAGLQGRPAAAREELVTDRSWQEARAQVESYA